MGSTARTEPSGPAVPKEEKGRVDHTFRFREVRRGELGSWERGSQGSAAAGGGDGGAGEARVPGQARRAGGAIRR